MEQFTEPAEVQNEGQETAVLTTPSKAGAAVTLKNALSGSRHEAEWARLLVRICKGNRRCCRAQCVIEVTLLGTAWEKSN